VTGDTDGWTTDERAEDADGMRYPGSRRPSTLTEWSVVTPVAASDEAVDDG
jgi:hypothetical protein